MAVIRSNTSLIKNGLVPEDSESWLNLVKQGLDIRIPDEIGKNLKNNPTLSKQFVPSKNELLFLPEELNDPIGDERFTPVKGLTHRYGDRALLKLTYHCGVYCRFCFRRYKVSKDSDSIDLEAALDYLRSHPEIWEVILTGGDPLMLADKELFEVLDQLNQIESLKVIRFHTRMPSAVPKRVTPHLIERLKGLNKAVWVVAHINSHLELSPNTNECLNRLIHNGIPVVSQSVLLKGVNDSIELLQKLFRGLVEQKVKPYYLHYPDFAEGTSHFRIPLDQAIQLFASLRGKISGLCLPQFILDIPGGLGKISLEPERFERLSKEQWRFKSPLDDEWIFLNYPIR